MAAQEGNRFALELFASSTIKDVRSLCWHLGDPDTVEDLVQETYARMMTALPKYSGGSAKAWILRIARNTCVDATRFRKRYRDHHTAIKLPELADSSNHSWIEVKSVIDQLDEQRKSTFVMTQILGMSYQDVAETLEIPVGTVRSSVARAREMLLKKVQADRRALAV